MSNVRPHDNMSLNSLRSIGTNGQWREFACQVAAGLGQIPASVEDFETYWIEAGHKVREQVTDDRLLCNLLRSVLPPYRGTEVTLFRGENRERLECEHIGLNWTTKVEVARMFASGLNACNGGGVLLRAVFPANKIIAAPSKHSIYLQEHQFNVEPPHSQEVELLEHFPGPYAPTAANGA